MVRILIADNQLLVREGVRSLLSGDKNIQIVGEARDGKELAHLVQKIKPAVVIMDFDLPGFFRIEDVEAIYKNYPEASVLIVTGNQDRYDIQKVIDLGVRNYIFKTCEKKEFIKAVYAASKKERFFCGKVIDILFQKNFLKEENCDPASLSHREVEVIKLISQGLTNNRIAEKLQLSIHTVGTHRKNILKKLNLKNSTEVVMYSIKTGIISADEK